MSQDRAWNAGRAWLLAGALTLAVGTLGATPARAGDEFERAFKYELGRIAAHEAVHAGKHVLGAVVHGGHGHYGHGQYSHGHPGHGHGHYKHGHYKRGHGHYKHGHYKRGYGHYKHGYYDVGDYPPSYTVVHEHHHYHYSEPCDVDRHDVYREDAEHRPGAEPVRYRY